MITVKQPSRVKLKESLVQEDASDNTYVYVLTFGVHYEGEQVIGVFSSYKKAEEVVDAKFEGTSNDYWDIRKEEVL
ncbi:hypothetical protein NVP1262O_52 [Vibrio phage 1.262.O._10N.286.51.A9]|nr:hypothetical protein NVP1262O_52 [Vibrio phage 1.262.O._10N.286.51.A9]